MSHKNHCGSHSKQHNNQHHGLAGVFGGMINLTTASLYATARVVRTVVENAVWHGCEDNQHNQHDCHQHSRHHCKHVYHCSYEPLQAMPANRTNQRIKTLRIK